MSTTIQAVLFDAAETLIHLPRGVGWHYRHIAARHGMELDETGLSAAFRAAFKAAAPRISTGVSRPDDDKLWWRGVVLSVLKTCGHEPGAKDFEAMFEELYAHFAEPGVWALYPEVLGVLEALHPLCKLGIVSNFDRRLYPVLEGLGIRHYFQSVVISSEVGLDKPDPRIFAAAFSALGVTAEVTVHAGDHPEQDWRAAELAGIYPYRVERPGRGLEGLPEFVRSFGC
jgi:putative hydrolase of the HAD superfamily